MRYNLIWSSAIALSLIITSLSYAQTIEIDFRSGINETGRSLDNASLGSVPFSVPVLEDERTDGEQLMLTVNGFTGGLGAEIQASSNNVLGLGIHSFDDIDEFFLFDAILNESLTISFSQDLFIQELDLAGLLTPSPEQFTVNDIVIDNVDVNTRDEFSFVTDANPDGMFLAAGETLRLAATNGSIALQGLTVEVVTDDIPIDLICDVNRDGVVDFLDIAPFILVLSLGEFQVEADCNQDGVVDFLDIAPFILILSS